MHTVGTRILVMRCDPAQLPRLYADVLNKRLKPVGKVVEVFGSWQLLMQRPLQR